jgi:acyl-CoA synthetase (AMP-forming)/AMP-acid ligase II
MGLIGMTLASLCAGGPRWTGGGRLVLIPPEHFLRDPSVWFEACARYGSTITAAPDFALGLVARRGVPHGLDLSALRACIVGGEPIRAATLEQFAAVAEPRGFERRALCPSYGLAEATLAVTMLEPAEPWRTAPVPGGAGLQCVSSGTPLDGVDVSIDASVGVPGRIQVRGPNVFAGYLGGDGVSGSLRTNDEGFVEDGHLYVLGRADDVIVVRGRNLHPAAIEAAVEAVEGVRAGAAVVVAHGTTIAVVAETDVSVRDSLRSCAEAVRRAAVVRCGLQPDRVVLLEVGALPKTASGKKRRPLVAQALAACELEAMCDRSFGDG